jgi:hypothetical protein
MTFKQAQSAIVLFVLALGSMCVAQQPGPAIDESTSSSAQQTPKATLDEVTTDSKEPRSMFGEAFGGRFTVTTNAEFQQEYDDNILSSSILRLSDSVSRFSGRISATMLRKHLTFEMHYLPGYAKYAKYDGRDSYSQQGSFDLKYAFTARTSMRLDGIVSDSSSNSLPNFSIVRQGTSFAPAFSPNGLQVGARTLSSSSTLSLDHVLGPADKVYGAIEGGTTSFSNEFGTGVSRSLSQDTYSAGGYAGWNHAIKQGRFFGVQGGYRFLSSGIPGSHINYGYAKLRFEQEFARKYSFRIGAGPSFTTLERGGIDTSYAIDAGLTRTGRSVNIGFDARHGAQLGSLQGTINATSASAFANLHRWRRWNTTSSLSFARNSQINSQNAIDSYAVGQRIGYDFSPAWQAFASYSYATQIGDSIFANQTFHRNLIGFGISYTLSPAVRY